MAGRSVATEGCGIMACLLLLEATFCEVSILSCVCSMCVLCVFAESTMKIYEALSKCDGDGSPNPTPNNTSGIEPVSTQWGAVGVGGEGG